MIRINPEHNSLIDPYNEDNDPTKRVEILPETEEKNWSLGEALAEIHQVIYMCNVRGANDSEIPALNQLIEDMQKAVITPSEAVTKAHGILDSKMDYH